MGNKININLIIDFIKAKNLSKNTFCTLCKISTATLDKILAGKRNFRIIALFKIARLLGVQIYEMFA